jgi:hypothetical protein
MPVEITDAEKLARAVLMFFKGDPWSAADGEMWLHLTGSTVSTTKTLCDLARKVRSAEEVR